MRLSVGWILLVPTLALGGSNPVDDAIRASKLAVLEISGAGACALSWDDPTVRAAAQQADARTLSAPRTKETITYFVGDGYTPATLRLGYRDGQEVDRLCGCGTADEVSTWIADLATGRTHAARLRAIAQAPARDVVPIGAWIEVAQAERCADRLDDAYRTLVTLWDEIPVKWPEQRALRLSRVAYELGALAERHAPARTALIALRDGLDASKDTDLDANDEWVALNRILHDDARTLAWFDAARVDPTRAEMGRHQAPNVFELWVEAGRWADAGGLIDDPIAWLGVWRQQPGGLDGAVRGYAALRAADRAKDAAALAKVVLREEKADASRWACSMIARSTQVRVVGKDQRGLAKVCADTTVVAAWTAASP